MKRLVIFLTILYFFLTGCVSVKRLDVITNPRHILFDKVRLGFKHQSLRVKARGFIKMDADSLVSFKFWGPLGLELVKGDYANSLTVFNYIENSENEHLETKVFKEFGLVINRKCIEYFLVGDSFNLLDELKKLNQYSSQLQFSQQNNDIKIKNLNSADFIEIQYKMKRSIPFEIDLILNDKEDMTVIKMEYISINATRL